MDAAVTLGFFAASVIGPAHAEEVVPPGFSTKFSVPPYAMDETILGVDGWQPPGGSVSKEALDAVNYRVVEDPIGNQGSEIECQPRPRNLGHSLGAIGLWSSAAAVISVYLTSLSIEPVP